MAVVAALLAAGCAQTATIDPPTALPEAEPGGTLRVGILEPRTIAPWLTSTLDPYGSLVVDTMCDTLVEVDPRTGDLIPALLVQWKTPNSNELIGKLRKDLRFPDGTKVDAEDITSSYARVAKSEIASPVADTLAPVVGWDELRELAEAGEDPRMRDRLLGLRSPEPTSIQVTLASAAPDFFTALSHPLGAVIPLDRYRADPAAMERQPVCVGPYRLAAPWDPGQDVIQLVRSESYHAGSVAFSRGGAGWADTIEFHVLPDDAALLQAFREGRVDLAYLADDLVPEARQVLGDAVVTADLPAVEYLGLPVKTEPWSDPDVRKAVSLAIDRRALAAALPGPWQAADGFVPPALGSNYATGDARQTTACAKSMPAEGDLEAAKEALRAAGVDLAGTTMTVAFNDEFSNRTVMEAVAGQLRERLGLKVELEGQNWETYLTTGTSTTGFTTPFRFSWAEQYPDPSRYLAPLFSRATLTTDNFSRFTSKEFDDLIEEALESVNQEDRQATLLEAENLICIDLPMVPLLFAGRAYMVRHDAVGSAVQNLTDRTTGQPLVRDIYVKQ